MTKKTIDSVLKDHDMTEEDIVDNAISNFSADDLSRLTSLLSLYDPMLRRSYVLNKTLLTMHEANNITLCQEHLLLLETWIQDFTALNESLRALTTNEVFH